MSQSHPKKNGYGSIQGGWFKNFGMKTNERKGGDKKKSEVTCW